MIVWNPEKNRVLYREDKEGNRVYPFGDDKKIIENSPVVEKENELTKKEICQLLDEKGISYNKQSNKSELLELLEK